MKRREALRSVAAGAAGLLFFPRIVRATPPSPDPLDELAARFVTAPRDEVARIAAKAMSEGAGTASILGAVFLAGIREVRPRHVGGKLHCVLMVESAFQLCERIGKKEAALTALWNLDDFKRSQQIDEGEGDWRLPPRPEASFPDEAAARREFVSAMESWDAPRADRALTGLLAWHDHDTIFELLWPFAARCYVDIGHKIIYGAQVERVLRRIGWSHAEEILRSLVFGLLHGGPGGRTEVFERTKALAPSLPEAWSGGREDPARSAEILQKLRVSGSDEAQALVIEALREGIGLATIWDGMRLAASELFLRRPTAPPERGASLLPVHAVTVTNALAHAWRTAKSDSTRRLMLLQAAGWLPDLRRDLLALNAQVAHGPSLDTLGVSEKGAISTLDESLASRSSVLLWRRLDAHPEEHEECRNRLASWLASRGVEHHQHKYAAVLMEESRLVNPLWASRILAPAAGYLPDGAVPESEVTRRSLHALAAYGIA